MISRASKHLLMNTLSANIILTGSENVSSCDNVGILPQEGSKTSSQLQGHTHPCHCHTNWAKGPALPHAHVLKWSKKLINRFFWKQGSFERVAVLMDVPFFVTNSLSGKSRSEMIEHRMYRQRRRGAARNGGQWSVGRDGSDRCKVGFRRAGMGRKARREREQRGERGDPVPGCILPCPALLQPESKRASSGWLTLPLTIHITQALLLCLQPWFFYYLLTLHSIEDDNEIGGRENTVIAVFYFRGPWQYQRETIYEWCITCHYRKTCKNRSLLMPRWVVVKIPDICWYMLLLFDEVQLSPSR